MDHKPIWNRTEIENELNFLGYVCIKMFFCTGTRFLKILSLFFENLDSFLGLIKFYC